MLRLKATKTSLYKLVREYVVLPLMKRASFTKASRRPDYWLDWTDAGGLRWRAFLAVCAGRAKLILMREDYSGCLKSIAFYTLEIKDLQARGMVEEFVTAAERRRAERRAACGKV